MDPDGVSVDPGGVRGATHQRPVPPISVQCHPPASALALSLAPPPSLGSAHLGRQSVRHRCLFMLPDVSAALYLYLMAFLRFPLFLLFLLFQYTHTGRNRLRSCIA